MNVKRVITLLFLTILCSCNNDSDVLTPNPTSSSEIPTLVKEMVSKEELILLEDISKNHKIDFFKPTAENKIHLDYLSKRNISKKRLIDKTTDDDCEIDTNIPMLKTRSEDSSTLGRVGERVYEKKGATATITVTAYWEYTKENGLLKSINTCDVDHQVSGIPFITYFVSQGTTYKIASNKKSIDYLVAGAIRYRVLLADGNLGAEVTLEEFSCQGNVEIK